MIIKHRRGTTKEWQEVDLIPEQGELVIEECIDGSLKCKIGTGYTKFSKLPYIDDQTKYILLQEIERTKADLEEKITDLNTNLSANVATTERKLTQAISTIHTKVEEDFISRDAAIVSDVNKRLDSTAKTLREETATAIKAATMQSSGAQANLKAELEADFDKSLAEATNSLKFYFNTALDTEEQSRKASDNELRNSISAVSSQANSKITSATDELSKSLTARIDKVSTEVEKAVSDLTSELETTSKDIDNKFAAQEIDFNSKLQKVADDATKAIDNVDERVSSTITDFNSQLVSQTENFNDRLLSADARIGQELEQLGTELASNVAELETKLADQAKGFDNKLSDLTNNTEQAIDNTNDRLSAVVIDFATQMVTQAKNFDKKLSNAENKTTAELERIDSKIADNETDFAAKLETTSDVFENKLINLSDKTASDVSKLNKQLTSVVVDFDCMLRDCAQNLSGKIAVVRDSAAELADRITTAEGRLDIAETTLADNIDPIWDEIAAAKAAIKDLEKDFGHTGYIYLEQEMNKQLDALNSLLLGRIEAVEQLISESIEREIAELQAGIAEVETSFDGKLSEATAGLTGAIEALEKRIIGDSGELGDGNKPNLTNLQNQLNDLKESMANELDIDQEGSFANTIQTNIDANTVAIEDLNAKTTIALMGVETSINEIAAEVEEANAKVTSSADELTKVIEEAKAEINTTTEGISNQIQSANDRIDVVDLKIDVQAGRIDDLIALPAGSTALDGEVIDIRRGSDGKLYGSAGSAVRAISERLSQYVDTEAITGLYYDLKGELDETRPYTLYLTKGNDEVIEESGVQIISGAGGGGGGGGSSSLAISYITTSPVKVTTKDEVILEYNFSGTDSSGDKIHQASATWKINGTTVEYGTVKDGYNKFIATKYLRQLGPGDAKVFLTVTDDSGSVATKKWDVQQIELSISSDFDDKECYPAGEKIIFTYTPVGALQKTVIFKLDGTEVARKTLEAGISGIEDKQEIPPQAHGAHLLEVSLEASIDDIPIPPVSIAKDIIWYDPDNNKTPVIGTVDRYIETKQYSTSNIVYTVYDPNADIPTATIEVDGEIVATQQVVPNKDYDSKPTAIYPYVATSVGTHIIKITCGTAAPKEITVNVKKLDIAISPITTGLVFDFNPIGKTNEHGLWNDNGITMSVSDNFDWTNGGYLPNDQDGPCFCIKAGSSATIDYKLFADDATKLGKEFKFVFKTKNVSNPDAVFLSCLDNTTDKDYIGLRMGVHEANIYGQNGKLDLVYSEDDVIEFEFNISKYSSSANAVNMVMGYEDGVPSRPMIYDSSYNFTQKAERAKVITLGSPDCDLYIYRCKAYNTSLSNSEILSNFIADARTPEEMIARYNRNQIYDSNHKLNPDVLAEKCPWLRVYKLSAPHFTNNKSDKVDRTTIQQIYKNGDPVLDNWTCYNAQHSGQGTSSNNYGAAGRNLDFIMNGSTSYFELGDGTTASEITLTRNSVPVAYLNAKVNIASSNNLTNAILANRYNRFNPYVRPFVRPDDYAYIDYIKDTMEFHNCVIFIQETDPKLSTHREFADTDWHFYAIGNIGDSKKTDKTRATDPDDTYECCVEIMDVKLPLSDFPVDTMMNAMGYTEDEETKERIYTWAKDENRDILFEREYTLTTDSEINLNKTYYIDMPVKAVALSEHLFTENLPNLFERLYVLTVDSELVKDKVYYLDDAGTVATKDFLQTITNPSDAGLYEWRREYKNTSDTEIVQDKTYYVEVMEKTNAMGYTVENVRNYLWAKDENLGILYEYIDGEYVQTNDLSVDLNKIYYTKVEEKDADGNVIATTYNDAMGYVEVPTKVYTYAKNENLDKLYEVTYFKTEDTTIDVSGRKTYYVDILEHDDFSEDYTYGWRYSSNKKDKAITSYCKQKWIEFYRFVTTSTDEEFKANLKNYFVVDSALYYYLFTERYCMVDNRAKNTFWHYSKTDEVDAEGNAIRKWDLCWDYDNDTSLGLNNYGKQVYRYGLEDIDVDESGEEVFREMDSLFFCRLRDLFAAELKKMYNDLESQDAWHAESFLEECDEWQDEFPEELWRLDIDRKYIRTYTSSFINGKGDNQFLVNMCNGKMKYHRRQWERNQAQYMASKYQTTRASGDNYHANFRFGGPTSTNSSNAVPANYQLTLTPYSYMYLNVQYGGTSPSTVRVTDANINTPITVPFYGNSADIVNVYSASSIRDFGDLSAAYPKTVNIGNASRVKKLKLGNSKDGYENTVFTTLTTDANPLLEELDVTNISSMMQTLDLSKLINLKSVKAQGTSVPSILFADGGKLNYAEIPALTSLKLKNLPYLVYTDDVATNKLKMASYAYVVDLIVDGCPLIDKVNLLSKCTNLNRVRLTDVNFGSVTYDYFKDNLFGLRGFSSTDSETPNAYISGTCYITSTDDNEFTGVQYENLAIRYPDLKINFNTLKSEVTFKYTNADGNNEQVLCTKYVESKDSVFGACENPGFTAPEWTPNAAFTYTQVGWSTKKQTSKGINDHEDDYKEYLQEDALLNVSCNRTLYPVFKAVRRSYTVKFVNPTVREGYAGHLLKTYTIPYGGSVNYYAPYENLDAYVAAGQPVPSKMDSSDPSLYAFTGWYPDSTVILGETTYKAQFTFLDSNWHELNHFELYNPKYNNSDGTMTFEACANTSNIVIKVPDKFQSNEGVDCKVTGLGFFLEKTYIHSELEHLSLPSHLEEIFANGFKNCTSLLALNLPESLEIIGKNAFQGCTKLQTVHIPANVTTIRDAAFADCTGLTSFSVDINNNNFIGDEHCLIDTQQKKLIQGITGVIPADFSVASLGQNCFSNMDITAVNVPEGVTTIGTGAFSRCYSLSEVTLPSTLTTLGSTCFAWCNSLENITLPNKLEELPTYAFNECALSVVKIPGAVDTVRDRAFGNMPSLSTVVFKTGRNKDGSIKIPQIHIQAFLDSGTEANHIKFYVPWSKQQHKDTFEGVDKKGNALDPFFGAIGVTYEDFIFDYIIEEAD